MARTEEERKKMARERKARYRAKQKENPEKYKEHLEQEKIRDRTRRGQPMTRAKANKIREKTKICT